jgi:hypothetical protein
MFAPVKRRIASAYGIESVADVHTLRLALQLASGVAGKKRTTR